MAKKKAGSLSLSTRGGLIEPSHPELSIRQQCHYLNLNRSYYYFCPATESQENLAIMRLIDEEYMRHPFLGHRKFKPYLRERGFIVNEKRLLRLMRLMGISALYPKPNLSKGTKGHKIYPYLLRNLAIKKPNQVWSTDITYIPMKEGFVYLTAVIDWYSRYVLAFELSNTLDTRFCIRALQSALEINRPQIFNTDQGSQFTSLSFTSVLQEHGIQISMDGKGRAIDNVFIERLWRSVKYELVYLKDIDSVPLLYNELKAYFCYYNEERHHQALNYQRPRDLYHAM
jgi:putative transposase